MKFVNGNDDDGGTASSTPRILLTFIQLSAHRIPVEHEHEHEHLFY